MQNGYRTTSMLVIPMRNRDNELVGVIQLINKTVDDQIVAFNADDQSLIESMASQATMMLENNSLVDELEKFLYALIKSIGSALDVKSTHTAKHVQNVASITEFLAKGVSENQTIFKDISFNDTQIEELKLSAWLHDIGKISTPEHIIHKRKKLETIFDRIEFIKAKFEIIKRDVEIAFLKNKITQDQYEKQSYELVSDLEFIELINDGQVYMSDDYYSKLKEISSKYTIDMKNDIQTIFSNDEYDNLSIKSGTITEEERDIINNHVIVTYDMLKNIPFPKKFRNVPKIAGSHHKTIDNKGYSSGEIFDLSMEISDKILAIADIFEALSSADRPYKDPYSISKVSQILIDMAKRKLIDKDLVKILIDDKLYLEYAKENLLASQIDNIDIDTSYL